MQPAADMANEIGQEANQGAGHAGHFDEKAEEHEQRNGEQNQVAHAFVHAATSTDNGVWVAKAR